MALRGLAVGVALLTVWCGGAAAAPGDLDRTFSGDGKLTIDLGGFDSGQDVAVAPNGRIVVGGFGWSGQTTTDLAAARLTAAGAFDGSFNGDGLARYEADGRQLGTALALQGDGKIVIAGSDTAVANTAIAVRLGGDGELDADFGGFGRASLWNGLGNDVLVQPDGKIVVAGNVVSAPGTDFGVGRLLTTGAPDPAFNGGASVSFGVANVADTANALALGAEGKLWLVGQTAQTTVDWGIGARLDTGAPDPLFGPVPLLPFSLGGVDVANDILVQPDGKLVVVGGGGAGMPIFAVFRFTPALRTDGSFCSDAGICAGANGVNMGGASFVSAAALQPDGKILLAGAANAGGAQGTIGVVRLLPNGPLDTSFSGDGRAFIDFDGFEEANAIAVQRDGGIVVVGRAGASPNADGDIVVARLQGDSPAGGPGGGGPGGGGPGSKALRCRGKLATLVGTRRKDRLRGTRRADVIVALGGNDSVKAGSGNDLVCGGGGNDSLAGEGGKDKLLGEAGKDKLGGGAANDWLSGGTSDDRLGGGPGTDKLLGDAGKDQLSGGPGPRDLCAGGSGKDRAACERGHG
jgi:uncharacterized delta-60 repeat protein